MIKSLKEILREAEKKRIAIGHFNVSDLATLKAVAETAAKLKVPVIIGTSEGEREFIDVHEAVSLIKTLREEHYQEIFLNADHTHFLEKVEEAAKAGYDAILFDGSKLSREENIKMTAEAVKLVKKINKNILVEGEIGYIGSGSVIRKDIPEGAAINPDDLTKPEEAADFVKKTGLDLLAPAVGNIHGMLVRRSLGEGGFVEGYDQPLNIERIRAIKKLAKVPLVLHGASGNTDEELRAAIQAGVSIIHISTELRVAWRRGLEESLGKNPEEIAPYKILQPTVEAVAKIVENKLRVFNNL